MREEAPVLQRPTQMEWLSAEFRVALRAVGVGAPIDRLVEALASIDARAAVSVNPRDFPRLLGDWNLTDPFKRELAGLIELIAGQRVARSFTAWFGNPPGQAPLRSSPRLDLLSLGDATGRRLAATRVVTLQAGERHSLELRLLLAESGDALAVVVLDCRRTHSGDRATQNEVDAAMESAVTAATSAAHAAGFARVSWSWLIRGAYPPVTLTPIEGEFAIPLR